MKAILLAAGLGTRLRPLTDSVPKCLVPIGGKPLLGIWLDLLPRSRFDEVIINTHYLPEAVADFVAGSPHRDRVRLVHEPALLGTAGTLRMLGQQVPRETFLLAHADNLVRFDPESFIARHLNRPPQVVITMMTFDTDHPESCGIVEETADGIVTNFHEKAANPPGRRANGAVYLMEPEVMDFVTEHAPDAADISVDVLPNFLGRMQTWHDRGAYLRDIGSPESLAAAEWEFASLPPL